MIRQSDLTSDGLLAGASLNQSFCLAQAAFGLNDARQKEVVALPVCCLVRPSPDWPDLGCLCFVLERRSFELHRLLRLVFERDLERLVILSRKVDFPLVERSLGMAFAFDSGAGVQVENEVLVGVVD
jgi:hypothetical protein